MCVLSMFTLRGDCMWSVLLRRCFAKVLNKTDHIQSTISRNIIVCPVNLYFVLVACCDSIS